MMTNKRAHLLAALALTAVPLTLSAADVVTINIPSGDLAAALESFTRNPKNK